MGSSPRRVGERFLREKGLGREAHLALFLARNGGERSAMAGVVAVFDLGEVDVVTLGGDEVDFVKLGFVIAGEEGVAASLEVGSNASFRRATSGGGSGGGGSRIKPFGCGFVRHDGSDWAEAATVFGGGAEGAESGTVGGGAVADVFFKAIVGILVGKVNHVLVAGDLGDDAGGGDCFDAEVGFL